MLKVRESIMVVAAAAIAFLPMAPAMAAGHGFRPLHPFGIGHGLVGAVVALATLPLVVASTVVAGVSESVAPSPSSAYASAAYRSAPPVAYAPPRPYYSPYPGYYGPRVAYGPRGYYEPRPSYYGRGNYHAAGNSYPRR
jgi:hypothetical protein